MKRKHEIPDMVIALGGLAGFAAGIALNPGGYTLLVNMALAGAGAFVGTAVAMLGAWLVIQFLPPPKEEGDTAG